MVELVAPEIVRVNITMIILAFAVDQDQRVVGPHTTNADCALSGLVRCFAHIDAL